MTTATITLIGGPTALVELDGFRLLTDPTFDDPGEYPLPHVTLKKTAKPALGPDQIGRVHAVLLSHERRTRQVNVFSMFCTCSWRTADHEIELGAVCGGVSGLTRN